MFDVFISYAREDRAKITSFAEFMSKRGLAVWFDDRIVGGQQPFEAIANALRDSSFVVLFWSASAAGSAFVQNEIAMAANLGKRIIPVRLDRRGYTGGVGLILANSQAIDARRDFPERELSIMCDRIEPQPEKQAPVIATLNMKGGVGKTTLSANLAAGFHSDFNKSVLIIELLPVLRTPSLGVLVRSESDDGTAQGIYA